MTNGLVGLAGFTLLSIHSGGAGPLQAAPPIACFKKGMTPEHERLTKAVLLPAVEEVRSLATGYALRFPAREDLAAKLATWVMGERKCCGFLNFAMRLDAGADAIWLELTGPAGAKEVLSATILPPLAAPGVTGSSAP